MYLTFVAMPVDYHLPPDTSAAPSRDFHKPCQPSARTGLYTRAMSSFSLGSIRRKVRGRTSTKPEGLSSNNLIQETLVDLADVDLLQHSMASSPAHSAAPMSAASTVSMTSTLDSAASSSSLAWALSSDVSQSVPDTPATPYSVASSSTNTTTTEASSVCHDVTASQTDPSPVGFRLMHVRPVSASEERIWRHAVHKTKRQLHLSHNCFPEFTAPSDSGLYADVVHWSLVQNEIVFSSESVTLLVPDHVYTLKSALVAYSTTQASPRLEDAVDELRRLVLVQAGRRLSMSTLMSRYTWLGPISSWALRQVTRMYRRAYGGSSGECGIEGYADDTSPNEQTNNNSHADGEWPLPNHQLCIISSAALDDTLSEIPPKPSPSMSPSEEDRSYSGYTEDSRNILANNGVKDKRFAIVPDEFQFRLQLEELPQTNGVLTERQEAETAAWLSDRNSGETVDFADRIFLHDLAKLDRRNSSPPATSDVHKEDVRALIMDVDQGSKEKTMPTKTEKPRLHLQTSPSPLPLAKPVALRAAPALKVQTTFDTNKAAKSDPLLAHVPDHPLPLLPSKTDDTFLLIGMTPIEVCMPGFDHFLNHNTQKEQEEEEEEEELTARPTSGHTDRQQRWTRRWDGLGSGSIEERLAGTTMREGGLEGPMTPNGYDDISPVTRGEWGFLFQGDTWMKGRSVRVETC
ncbi:hypothetical protein DL546_006805 [Coniochaeta pulveracea]|uniref:DUF7582 domain-containing protein n=1 Tax=Coniochaeta pulveracea TaxID=177199 RepID=A0A420YJF4_9PEZI|nr:hypothetical protein DL546_006805 [Coniochaeta pulveracea]